MVRNQRGGNKTKQQARKYTSMPSNYKLRKSQDKNEIYAVVTKLYGNGRVLVKCNDGEERICVIRKKFRGRNKRDNEASVGTLILVGRREFENKKPGKLENCDLLEVYSLNDRTELKREGTIRWNILQINETNDEEEVDFLNIPQNDSDSDSEDETQETQPLVIDRQKEDMNIIGDLFGETIDVDEI